MTSHTDACATRRGTTGMAPAAAAAASMSSERVTRLVLGCSAVVVLSIVALLSRPSGSIAGQEPGSGGAARLPRASAARAPQFTLEAPATRFYDGEMLAGHAGIPVPPEQDAAGRSSLGVLVGPALFVWVYGGAEGVRYTVVDLRGQVLAEGLTTNEVYGAFPEINIPEMEFGSDGRMCEPVMWAGDDL